eukprot:15917341-Heterocapsa_arctica.AAC.1
MHNSSVATILLMARLVMQTFTKAITQVRMAPCTVKHEAVSDVFRVDAKADGNNVVIAGWKTGEPNPGDRR